MEASFKSTLTDKRQRYAQFLEQFAPLIEGEKNEISVLANTSAALKEAFGFFWVGFYLVHEGELHLGPFRAAWPATASRKDAAYAAPPGLKPVPNSCPT